MVLNYSRFRGFGSLREEREKESLCKWTCIGGKFRWKGGKESELRRPSQ